MTWEWVTLLIITVPTIVITIGMVVLKILEINERQKDIERRSR